MGLASNLPSILLNSGLIGDDLDNLFINTLFNLEDAWILMNTDEGHSDANQRARSNLEPQYWKYLSTPPKY